MKLIRRRFNEAAFNEKKRSELAKVSQMSWSLRDFLLFDLICNLNWRFISVARQ